MMHFSGRKVVDIIHTVYGPTLKKKKKCNYEVHDVDFVRLARNKLYSSTTTCFILNNRAVISEKKVRRNAKLS